MKPYDADTLDKVCSLKRDNIDVGSLGVLIDGDSVTLTIVEAGQAQSLFIPRKDFNKLVNWYMTDQPATLAK